ncbi:hypothetical protein [Hymenobacter negativus]|uniref:Uncharacterized protein n=1 Tax=Hymenobacter negativus TaxID=2795026 RepID=A0ABS3QIP0_9BACT|nr:hypothetical protein [Hymenobacter negativus]MBO2010868.1 hypothetical protein [Hymenobacter negativus]
MKNQPESMPRTPSRKSQINIEVNESEKIYFGQVAEARNMKLAALVRELLNAEGKRLGAPALLDDFKSQDSRYQYIVDASESSETKLGIFSQFLLRYEADCDFSITTYEPRVYNKSVECSALSSSGESTNRIFIGISPDEQTNFSERTAIDGAWRDVLGLSLNLEDKWDGVSYSVEMRRSLRGKKLILQQFVNKYNGAKFKVNPAYAGRTIFKVVANNEGSEHELLIAYFPQRTNEESELKQALDEYMQQA